jgi:HK97 family phage major capsid protein
MKEEEKEISIEEITAQVKAEIAAEAKAKAEAEAVEAEKKAKLEEEIREKVKAELSKTAPAAEVGAPAVHTRTKMDETSETILDLVKGRQGGEISLDINLAKAEETLQQKAWNGASTTGAELVPQDYATDLYVRMEAMGGGLFNRFPKAIMTSNIQNIHEITGNVTVEAYSSYATGNTAIENVTKSTPATALQTLNARTFVAKVDVYDQLDEDSKVNIVRALRGKMAMALDNQVSNAIINGDSDGTHQDEDSAALGANTPVAMWNGLRKYAMAVTGLNAALTDGGFTLSDLAGLAKLGGKYFLGQNMAKAFWILGPKGYNALRALILANTATPTAATASLVNGELQKFLGYNVVTSEYQREDLEDDGFYDITGSSLGKGFVSLVNPSEFIIGLRKNFSVKVVPDPLNGKKVVIGEMRLDFQPFETPSATVSSVVGGYGFTA